MSDTLKVCLVVMLGLGPPMVAFGLLRRAEAKAQARLQRTLEYWRSRQLTLMTATAAVEEPGFLGDLSCQFNARSPYLRCAVNPHGPCQSCTSYRPLT